jgi:hypothetical protein
MYEEAPGFRLGPLDPMRHKLKPPGTKRLKLKCHMLLPTSAFKFNLRRYGEASDMLRTELVVKVVNICQELESEALLAAESAPDKASRAGPFSNTLSSLTARHRVLIPHAVYSLESLAVYTDRPCAPAGH